MATKDSLGDRMKDYYENRYRISLPRRTNIIIRIDGKAFHTYTKGLKKPFDEGLMEDMNKTTMFLCENIQGAKMGYVQSDEISILMHDYDDLKTDAWFDNNLQKMASVSASLATAKFNQLRMSRKCWEGLDVEGYLDSEDILNFKLAMFDSRFAVIPEPEEVVNYFIWRQQDATRNSISMSAQSMFSHKELQGKSSSEMQDMMMLQKGVNWNDYPTRFKRGAAIVKVQDLYKKKIGEKGPGNIVTPGTSIVYNLENKPVSILGDPEQYEFYMRSSWKAVETPIFTQDRDFILTRLGVNAKLNERVES